MDLGFRDRIVSRCFLVSAHASYATGAIIPTDGGSAAVI